MTITRQMLFPLAFYKKTKFTGSKGHLNYRIEKQVTGEEDAKKEEFLLSVWEGPECYDATKNEKETWTYSFDEEGMEQILIKLNSM